MLGLLTLGHSPREDLEAPFRTCLPDNIPILMEGGLDACSATQIHSLALQQGDRPLHVITSGGSLVIQQEALLAPLTAAANNLALAGARFVVLLCTGDFPPIPAPVPVITPGQLLAGAARSVSEGGRLGVIIPGDSQRRTAEERWQRIGFEPVIYTAPVKGDEQWLIDRLHTAEVRQVVLDCISFSPALQQQLLRELDVPVWLPSRLAAHTVAELFPVSHLL